LSTLKQQTTNSSTQKKKTPASLNRLVMADYSNPNRERRDMFGESVESNVPGMEELSAQLRSNAAIAKEFSGRKLNTIAESKRESLSVGAIDDYVSDDESVIVKSIGNDHIEAERVPGGDAQKPSAVDLGFAFAKKQIMEGTQSSFEQLFQTWGSYIDDRNGNHLESLGMLQQLDLCGPDRLPISQTLEDDRELYEPIVLRHTHSTPLRHTPSILNEDDEDEPQPVGLEILERSRSTPLSTSANSAFGTKLRTVPYLDSPDNRSAFTLPPYRLRSTKSMQLATSDTTFNPIQETMELDTELVSIEVMDMPSNDHDEGSGVRDSSSWKEKSVSLVSRFISDLRSFGRKLRNRGGRENPARPASSSDESSRKIGDVADEDTTSAGSPPTNGNGRLGSVKNTDVADAGAETSEKETMPTFSNRTNEKSHERQLAANVPVTDPSLVYHQLDDDHQETEVGRVRIQVSRRSKESLRRDDMARNNTVSSPMPSQSSPDSIPQATDDSPGRSRSSGTTYTSGQTTQRTVTSNSQMSQLSSISETDREVMEANKGGSSGEVASSSSDQLLHSIPLSSVRDARYAGYTSLEDSPHLLRDGANVPAERFFTFVDSDARGSSRLNNSSSTRKSTSRSPTTVSSSSINTSSTTSTFGDEPPIFVSYLDRKTVSDLTTSRLETSSPRAREGSSEQRESSPSEILLYSDIMGEESSALKTVISKKPRPMRPSRGAHHGKQRIRSLPPRGPIKGGARGTPPPSSSISPVGLYSSSGNDHFRRILDDEVDQGEQELVRMTSYYMALPRSSPNVLRSHTYDEHSIEILKTDSKEESNLLNASPESGTGEESI
jgi:hypothetical protein